MNTFSKEELMILSDGLLGMIEKANAAVRLIPEPKVQKEIAEYRDRLVKLNYKVCNIMSEMESDAKC